MLFVLNTKLRIQQSSILLGSKRMSGQVKSLSLHFHAIVIIKLFAVWVG